MNLKKKADKNGFNNFTTFSSSKLFNGRSFGIEKWDFFFSIFSLCYQNWNENYVLLTDKKIQLIKLSQVFLKFRSISNCFKPAKSLEK